MVLFSLLMMIEIIKLLVLIICLVLNVKLLNKLNEPYNINNLNCNTPLNIFEGLDVSI
jgi:hypothetical protein